jgi:hypothetical protein
LEVNALQYSFQAGEFDGSSGSEMNLRKRFSLKQPFNRAGSASAISAGSAGIQSFSRGSLNILAASPFDLSI